MNKILIVIIVAFLFSGCATTSQENKNMGKPLPALNASTILKFDDVPIPIGFKIVAKESFIFKNDYTRMGVVKYLGNVDVDRTVNFFKEQMQTYNWSLISIVEYGQRILNYEKANESCLITLEPNLANTQLVVYLTPKQAQVPGKRAKP